MASTGPKISSWASRLLCATLLNNVGRQKYPFWKGYREIRNEVIPLFAKPYIVVDLLELFGRVDGPNVGILIHGVTYQQGGHSVF
jgi:hypothetical protein